MVKVPKWKPLEDVARAAQRAIWADWTPARVERSVSGPVVSAELGTRVTDVRDMGERKTLVVQHNRNGHHEQEHDMRMHLSLVYVSGDPWPRWVASERVARAVEQEAS